MDDLVTRIAENMADRVSGPMKLRLVMQPLMASIFAIRAGLADAKAGRPPYFWSLLSRPDQRAAMLKDGWKSVGEVFVLAIALDVVYQLIEQGFVYPVEALLVAVLLAIAPYLLLRGPVSRIAPRGGK
jgi:hypothetical protein